MSENTAVTVTAPSDLVTVLTAPAGEWDVIIGRSEPEQVPPFVACWPLDPLRAGEGLATEDWGQVYTRWQINCFGATVAQTSGLASRILSLGTWGDRFALDQVGPMIPDDAAAPAWWFIPLTVRDVTAPV